MRNEQGRLIALHRPLVFIADVNPSSYHAGLLQPTFMKKSVLFFSILMSIPAVAGGQKQLVSLDKGWQFRLAPDASLNQVQGVTPDVEQATLQQVANWSPAKVPGFVQTDLLENKIIADPFYRENEKKLQWIGQQDWQYQTSFDVPRSILSRKHVELVFQGLDTY